MDERYEDARDQFFTAIRALAASPNDIQARLINACKYVLRVNIEQFEGDLEMKIKFARILDNISSDVDDMSISGTETTAHMTDEAAIKVADLICDFYYDLG